MIVLVCLFLIAAALYVWYSSSKPYNFPPGPECVPLLGSLPTLKKLSKQYGGQYLAFAHLAKQYRTNIIGFKLGAENVIVVFNYDLVRKILTEDNFQARPNSFFLKLRCLGKKRGITCTEGPTWMTHRTFLVKHLRSLGFGKTPMENMIREELHELEYVIDNSKGDVRISRLLAPSVLSVLWGLTAGVRISRNDPQLHKFLDTFNRRSKAFDMAGGLLNIFPFLRFVAPNKSGYNIIKAINEELKDFVMKIIREHYDSWTEGRNDDVIYAFISEMKKNRDPEFTEDQLLMVCLDVFIAGAETTSNTLDFAFLNMLLYPEVQKKVHQCLDEAFKDKEELFYSDRFKVPYVEAVLFESERFCHVAPIIGPRRTLNSTSLDGYNIPKDTTILISLHSVHFDPDIWGDPENFRPERFINEEGGLIYYEKMISFGLGKRRCLGEMLARSCIFIFFAGLMRKYDVVLPEGHPIPSGKPVPGITSSTSPYTVLFRKRK